MQILLPKPPPMSCETKRSLSIPTLSAGPIMICAKPGNWLLEWIVHWAVPRLYSTTAPLVLERSRGEAVEVQALDPHDLVGLGERRVVVAAVELALPDHVRADVVVEERRRGIGRALGVEHRLERLVVDLDELGGVAGQLARRSGDRDDGLADVRTRPTASA